MLLNEKYSHIPDEVLIEQLRKGNGEITDYLLDKYKYMVRKKARVMFIIGGDTDDLIQEGMIGLYKAIRDFNIEKESSFLHFATLCINRQIYTAINASQRKKHSPLNSSVSLFETGDGNNIYVDEWGNPERLLIAKENIQDIEKVLDKNLSKYEQGVLKLYIEGNDYNEIAEMMDKKPKSIDNAIQRIKGKLKLLTGIEPVTSTLPR